VVDSRHKPFRSSRATAPSSPPFRSASLRSVRGLEDASVCALCGEPLDVRSGAEAEAGTDGSLAWRRGERVEFERVRQCDACAAALAYTMLRRSEDEDDGG
jgi:hypothetical protein